MTGNFKRTLKSGDWFAQPTHPAQWCWRLTHSVSSDFSLLACAVGLSFFFKANPSILFPSSAFPYLVYPELEVLTLVLLAYLTVSRTPSLPLVLARVQILLPQTWLFGCCFAGSRAT